MAAEARWVFWDFDGTLVDSVPALYEAYLLFLKASGRRGTRAEFERLNGPTLPEIVAYLKKKHRLRPPKKRLLSSYRSAIKEIYGKRVRLRRGARAALESLKRAGFRQMLVTSCSASLALPCLKRNRIQSFFETSLCGDGVKRSKPHPAIYRLALKKAAARPKAVRVIEDSPNGIAAARAAGLRVYALNSGGSVEKAAGQIISDADKAEITPLRSDQRLLIRSTAGKAEESSLFCIHRILNKKRTVEITGRFVPYGRYRRRASAFQPLGVSGVVTARRGGRLVYLVGLRSDEVFAYKKHWEFVPSGGVDGTCAGGRGQIDPIRMIYSELLEEAGVSEPQVLSARPAALVFDGKQPVTDIVVRLTVSADTEPRFNRKEYLRMAFYSEREVRRLLSGPRPAVPTSVILWNYLQNSKGAL